MKVCTEPRIAPLGLVGFLRKKLHSKDYVDIDFCSERVKTLRVSIENYIHVNP